MSGIYANTDATFSVLAHWDLKCLQIVPRHVANERQIKQFGGAPRTKSPNSVPTCGTPVGQNAKTSIRRLADYESIARTISPLTSVSR